MKKVDLKNGMIVTLRRGVTRVVIGKRLFDEQCATHILDNYNDDLTPINNCNSEDIIKIEYGGKIIWERSFEWEKVQFGAKVRAWWDSEEPKQTGKFLCCNKNDEEMRFLVFVERDMEAYWFKYCELVEEAI